MTSPLHKQSMKRLPLEAWILTFLIVEVLIVNWKLVFISSDDSNPSCSVEGARIWKSPPTPIPCDPISIKELNVTLPSDFVYVSNPYDDRLGSIAVRIAKGMARRRGHAPSDVTCRVSFRDASTDPPKSNPSSFRWRMVQDPTQQTIEDFYRENVSHLKRNPNDVVFQQAAMKQTHDETTSIQHYDFVGVVERMEESLVVLKILLNLDTTDLLYLDNPSPFELAENDDTTTCVYQVKPYVSIGMKAFFDSQIWQAHTELQLKFYEAANRSLDATIDVLGRARVQKEVQRYQETLQKAQEECKGQAIFPCTESGQRLPDKRTTCHFGSVGCGHDCLDKMFLTV